MYFILENASSQWTKYAKTQAYTSSNKWKYNMTFRQVYESAKLDKRDCAADLHIVCTFSMNENFDENNELYTIYGKHAGQEVSFMRKWLHFFVMDAYRKYCVSSGYSYLKSKGMDINLWAESIIDGRKADFFTLFAINILLETHTAVHLRNDEIWSMLKRQPMDHNELLNKCNFHMAYVGRCLFVELTNRKHPIIIVDSTHDIKAIDMCCLMHDKLETVDSIIFKGLVFGKDPDKSPNCTSVPFIKDLPGPMIKSEPTNTKIQDTVTVTLEQSSQKSDKEKAEPARKEKDLENKSTDDKPAEDDIPVRTWKIS